MKNIVNILFLTVFLSLLSCNNITRKSNLLDSVTETKVDSCFLKQEKENIIKAILNTSDFQTFLHPELKERLPIRIRKNEFITCDLTIESNGFKVIFIDSLNFDDNLYTHNVNLKDLDCKQKIISYSIYYPIESASINGVVQKTDKLWIASVTSVGEID